MRIGIDCRTILSADTGELAGTAHYTHELVRHLIALQQGAPLHTRVPLVFVLFFDGRVKSPFRPPLEKGDRGGFKNVEIITLRQARLPLLTTHWLLSRALTRAKLDIFHSPAHPLPLFYHGKMIYTVHDLAIYDHPEWFPGGMRQWFSTRFTVPRSIRRAAKLIAPSENTKRDIIRLFNAPEKKIRVIYEGKPDIIASEAKSPPLAGSRRGGTISRLFENEGIASSSRHSGTPRNDSEESFFLFVGTIEPRKNLVRLIDAFIQFRQTYNLKPNTYHLILVGANGWNNADIFMAIERANLKLGKGAVQYLGYVSEEEKIALFKNATAFVWPSLYEGFGLPVLEAMAAGVPVITSNVSSIPEITSGAALLIDPEYVEGLVGAMQRIASDENLREQLKTRGLERAKRFTWEKTAEQTLTIYKEVLCA